jgi:hypothetical protein
MWPHDSNIPNGFLVCDGSQYSTTTYSELYSVIGNLYGSNLPNLNSETDLMIGNSNMSNNSTTLTSASSSNPITGGNNTIKSDVISDHSHTISINSNSLGYNYKSKYNAVNNADLEFNMVKGNFGFSNDSDAYDDGGSSSGTYARKVHNHIAYYDGVENVTTTTSINATYNFPSSTKANYTIADYSSGAGTQNSYDPLKFHVCFIIYTGVYSQSFST